MAEGYGAAAKTLDTMRASSLTGPVAPMDADDVRAAYKRWASNYDNWFGVISKYARRDAVAAVNRAPGEKVLEVGVGTGLALPLYDPAKRVTGIDLSTDMLAQARMRAGALGLRNLEALLEMDAQATNFADGQFDIAVAMFVASVVPDPRALVAELKRVVRPGGTILFVNHFAARRGPVWWTERAMAPLSAKIGWHPDFRLQHLLLPGDLRRARVTFKQPLGIFRLVELPNV